MNSVIFEKVGRVTCVIVYMMAFIVKNLQLVAMLLIKPIILLTPVIMFWLSLALVSFGGVTLAEIVENPAVVFNLSLTASMLVGIYRLVNTAISNT